MAYDLEEQEKLDELKDFWNRRGTLVTGVIVLAALAVLGYRGWNYYQADQASKAAVLYAQLEKAITAKQMPLVREITGTMLERYSATAYAEMAALAAARANIDAGDLKAAEAQLKWTAEHAGDPEYRWVARLRWASVLLDEGAPEAALKALEGDVPPHFEVAVDDRRGDILAAQNQSEAARTQYQAALAKLGGLSSDVRTAYTNVLQLKLDALGSSVSAPPTAAADPAPAAPPSPVAPAAGSSHPTEKK